MHARRSAATAAALAALGLLAAVAPTAARMPSKARAEAERLVARARRYLEDFDDFDHRRVAARCLERAALLVPDHPPYRLAIADLYLRQGFLGQARHAYEAAAALDAALAPAHFGIGQTWRLDYLKYLDPVSLRRAIDGFSASARLDASRAGTWVQLAALLFERGDLRAAHAAAERAHEADGDGPDPLLALAATSYHTGRVEWAERAFERALPRLEPPALACFVNIDPVATEQDTAELHALRAPAAQAEFVRRFWQRLDPDLTTPVNEARVAFWARAAQAYFLYYDRRRREWDQRGEIYVRYGPPERAEYEPVNRPYIEPIWSLRNFPYNTLVWSYPGLGMDAVMTDRTLNGFYGLPPSLYFDTDPRPDPDSLARRGEEVLASRAGRGVFPRFVPGARRLQLWASAARFRGSDTLATRVIAAAVGEGAPAESLVAEAVVLDSALREVARGRRVMGPSACDPAEMRAAEFDFDLPPGRYLMGVSLGDDDGGRGVWRAEVEAPRRSRRLDLSDLEIACGSPPPPGDPLFRVAANPAGWIGPAEPLGVYFEIYGLTRGGDGRARFSVEYTVKSAARDDRPWISRVFSRRPSIPALSARREDEHLGELRRQFVSVPVQSLPAGRYRLRVRVRDELAQTAVEREVEFERLSPGS